MPEIPHNQWPPVKRAQYVNLALITNEDMMRTDLYSRATLHGSVDDILRKKQDIPFEKVFPEQLSQALSHTTLIEGRPGCGKTTLLVKVAKDWGRKEILKGADIFVLVMVRQFMGKANITREDIISTYCPQPSVNKAVVEFMEKNGGEGVVFALDGLDEYPHAVDKSNLIFKIVHGVVFPKSQVYVTSRPANAFRLREIATANIEIIGFLTQQIHKYIDIHYEGNTEMARSLKLFLENHPNIGKMCYLPLHLAMVVFLHESGSHMPSTETEMYHTFTLHTIFRALRRETESNSDPEAVDEIEFHDYECLSEEKAKVFRMICYLALIATERQRQVFTGKEILEHKVFPHNPTRREFDSLGLLTVDRQLAERALPTKIFSFLHLTHQEYLAAEYLSKFMCDEEQLQTIEEFKKAIHMRMVWKFYCGLSHQSKVFLTAFTSIVEANKDDRQAALHMMHCAYESTEASACVTLMKKLKGVMDVQDITLNPSDCTALGCVVADASKAVFELDMSYCHIGPEGMEAFVSAIESQPNSFILSEVHTLRFALSHFYKNCMP